MEYMSLKLLLLHLTWGTACALALAHYTIFLRTALDKKT